MYLTLSNRELVLTMADMEGGEVFDPNMLGRADTVVEERVGHGETMCYVL